MLSMRARVRPMRSATQPKSSPPTPLASNVSVASLPAVALLMPNSATMAEITSADNITSKASNIQPRAAAMRVRRWAGVVCGGAGARDVNAVSGGQLVVMSEINGGHGVLVSVAAATARRRSDAEGASQ